MRDLDTVPPPCMKYFASPGYREGTWAVIKQIVAGAPGYAVASELTREAAEDGADRLNAGRSD